MHRVVLPETGTMDAWREAARQLAAHAVPPAQVEWAVGEAPQSLFDAQPLPVGEGRALRVPRAFLDLADRAILHRDPAAPGLLYQALMRLQDQPHLLADEADPLVRRLEALRKSVRRDIHKMRAFVRFREIPSDTDRRRFAAWFEPEHRVVEANAGFFARRFADMDWAIHTPDLSVIFEDGEITFAPGAPRPDLPEDAAESLWATYFTNIFNPARIKLGSMRQHMPLKYWKNMPETAQIPAMLEGAESRVRAMQAAAATQAPARAATITERYRAAMPKAPEVIETLAQARQAVQHCTRCNLCRHATQAVFGEGPADAPLMVVGEQPGDQEDLQGRPFVGPAGKVLDEVMQQSGLDRGAAWMTNAVKHFKFTPRGKRRIHQSPDKGEVAACKWWLELERDFVKPQLTLGLGATAALALTGRNSALTRRRGTVEETADGPVLLSWHPSYILRIPDTSRAAEAKAELAHDLALARKLLAQG
ncbi:MULTISPECIES: UdgX family uracil-DNA binding protein [unclassified Paracoccus (in: a-proteobacteria)]|uniref:UdgX family uracil-DNA binding protein n=1 Tax=unclassified Paracoccus (in: a-proteobacteria) TaxID=2688777 RepID=UPI001600C5A6|nr:MULTISPECIES: UdgX family uracil-DNA binding protein [unclassified Paracoccus (in: a-proteobacteria)]MBB1489984.1 UdgX family uracil-DNA binding protein [Paracoccus sp. MC1854]MBB1496572.1 UdgX family uracil-DNA binding protein [Paracoccus sp. MC1862]QQO43595.1 UdgX family uracil-DNA binding protein [Paracoccus sp. MC1862]